MTQGFLRIEDLGMGKGKVGKKVNLRKLSFLVVPKYKT